MFHKLNYVSTRVVYITCFINQITFQLEWFI